MIYSVKAYKGQEVKLDMKYKYFQSFRSFYKGLLESLSYEIEDRDYSEGIEYLIVMKLDDEGNKTAGFKVLKTKKSELIMQVLPEEKTEI